MLILARKRRKPEREINSALALHLVIATKFIIVPFSIEVRIKFAM